MPICSAISHSAINFLNEKSHYSRTYCSIEVLSLLPTSETPHHIIMCLRYWVSIGKRKMLGMFAHEWRSEVAWLEAMTNIRQDLRRKKKLCVKLGSRVCTVLLRFLVRSLGLNPDNHSSEGCSRQNMPPDQHVVECGTTKKSIVLNGK